MYNGILQRNKYYHLSGKISLLVTMGVFSGAALTLFVAAFAIFMVESLYPGYGFFLVCAFAVLTGILSGNINQWGDNRNRSIGVLLCLTLGILATWFFWGFWSFRTWYIIHNASPPEFWYCFRPDAIIQSVTVENANFHSLFLTLIRSTQALIFIVAAIIMMGIRYFHASYCEACRAWTYQLVHSPLHVPADPRDMTGLRGHLEESNFSALENSTQQLGCPFSLEVNIRGCSCRQTICMTVKHHRLLSGKIPLCTTVVRNLLLNKPAYLYLKPLL